MQILRWMHNNNNKKEKTAMKKTEEQKQIEKVEIPCGKFCGHNCADGCIYCNPYDRDSNGRQYCSHYRSYYYPRERQGCLSFKD